MKHNLIKQVPSTWTYDEQTFNLVTHYYPTAYDPDNKTRVLESRIIDKFLSGKMEIALSQGFVLSTLKTSSSRCSLRWIEEAFINLRGLFTLHDYSEELKERLSDFKSDEEILEIWDNRIQMTYRFGDHSLTGCRVAIYQHNDLFEAIKAIYRQNIKSDLPRYYVETKALVTPQSRKTIKSKQNEYIDNTSTFYQKHGTLPNMVDYVDKANELTDSPARTKLINKHAIPTLNWVEEMRENNSEICEDLNNDPDKTNMLANYHNHTIRNIMDTPRPIYKLPAVNSPRIFDGLDQALAREIRSRIYTTECGCYDFDLCRSQLAIIAHLSDSPILLEWASKPNLWEEIKLDTGVPKFIAKPCLYTYCFGGNHFTWVDDDNNGMDWEYVTLLSQHPLYKELKVAGKKLKDKIEQQGYVEFTPEYKVAIDNTFTSKQAVAYKIQYIESMIINDVLDYVKDNQKQISLLGCYHDGILVKIKQGGKSVSNHLKDINVIAQQAGKVFGINNIQMEVK